MAKKPSPRKTPKPPPRPKPFASKVLLMCPQCGYCRKTFGSWNDYLLHLCPNDPDC